MTKHDKHRSNNIMSVIRDHQDKYGHPPTMAEIGEAVGLGSKSAVHHHLRRLTAEGLVRECADRCGKYWVVQPIKRGV